jgi:hypothetical protein
MTLSLRQIETDGYAKVSPPSTFGKPPRLEWLSIKSLVIDPEYQRDVTIVGRKNVRRIVVEFNWSMFSPVVVASVGGGRFAIVDGQHRTTAAALCGVDKVPCAIIECERGEQAAAFRAINGNTTRLHSIQVYHAGVVAGEPDAKHIAAVCKAAGISPCRYPKATMNMQPGETMSVRAIGRAAIKFGDAVVIPTLTAIRGSGDGNAGLLTQTIIYGSCEVMADHPDWCGDQEVLNAAFDEIDLGTTYSDAVVRAARIHGTGTLNQFEAILVAALDVQFKKRKRA